MAKLMAAALTDQGRKRKNNEDCHFVDTTLGLFLVADGMGGAASGELASHLTAETVSHYLRHYIDLEQTAVQRHDFFDVNLSSRANTLMQAIHLANDLVFEAAHKEDQNQGMGSTVAVLLLDHEIALVATVGDSRVYRSRGGILTRLTVDHRLSDDPKLKDLVDLEGTVVSRMGHTLTRAIGIRPVVEPDLRHFPVEAGDIYLLCSDGLSDMVVEDMIGRVLALDRPLEKKTQDLVELALAAGGRDNITVVLATVPTAGRLKGLLNKFKGG